MAVRHFQTVFAMICAGNYTNIVWHWEIDVTGTPTPFAQAKKIRDELCAVGGGSAVGSAICDAISDDSFISSLRVRELGVAGAPTAVSLFPAADYPGAFGTDLDAAQVAGCIIWTTAGNAGLNGRTFLPGVGEGAYASGRPSAGYKAAMLALGNLVIAPIDVDGDDLLFCLRSGDPPTTFTRIVHGYLSPDAGTQRRRLTPY